MKENIELVFPKNILLTFSDCWQFWKNPGTIISPKENHDAVLGLLRGEETDEMTDNELRETQKNTDIHVEEIRETMCDVNEKFNRETE